MPRRRYCSSSSSYSSASSSYSSSPSKSPPVRISRRWRLADEPRRLADELSSASAASSAYSSPASKSPQVQRRAKDLLSEKKQHMLVVCEHEKKDAKLLTEIRGKKLIWYKRPIGQVVPIQKKGGSTVSEKKEKSSNKGNKEEDSHKGKEDGSSNGKEDPSQVQKEPELQTFGCNVLRAIETFIRLLHRSKVTLQGQLNVRMLCWISSSKSVKLRKESIPKLKRYTHEGAKQDYISIGTSIEKDLFSAKGLKLPRDVLVWIGLMSHASKHKYLLRYNTALLNSRAKMDHFLSLYEDMLQLRKLANEASKDKIRYDEIIKKIPLGASEWWKLASKNKYIKKVYVEKIAKRSKSVFDFLTLIRDCIYHLMDYSIENGVIVFCPDDKYLMIESCFPGVFHQFERAMVDGGFKDICLSDDQGM